MYFQNVCLLDFGKNDLYNMINVDPTRIIIFETIIKYIKLYCDKRK